MGLSELIESSGIDVVPFGGSMADIEIVSVEYDSRNVREGSLFIAVEGFVADGHDFISQAVEAGAAAVGVNEKRMNEFSSLAENKVVLFGVKETRSALSALSAAFFRHPSREMLVLGVTGTNGKTSITYMLESILEVAGMTTGVVGTVNYRWGGSELPAPNTTPESKDLHQLLFSMKEDGVTAAIMEISSHALDLSRADHIAFDGAIFTNLTQDHLDFHKDFESYFKAKVKLFDILEMSPKKKKAGVVNGDDAYGRRLLEEKAGSHVPMIAFGTDESADYQADSSSIVNKITGLAYRVVKPEPAVDVSLQLAGTFHVYNSLGAFTLCSALGVETKTIVKGLEKLETVPGRFDVVQSPEGFAVVVDYAHTGDALEKLLASLQDLEHNRIITVFGCGGDRDRTKRPVMGKIALDNSDLAIVTSDNPRTEDPQQIIDDIVAGMKGDCFRVVLDREEAIARAVGMGNVGDIIVIAGKGHEDYQILGTEKIHFDDREMAHIYIDRRNG